VTHQDGAPARLLAEERARTRARLHALRRDFDSIVRATEVDPPDDEHDPEGATVAFERQQVAALVTRAERHLEEVEAAEQRLRSGTYGSCEGCGRAIARERLTARPTARRCVSCATVRRT
jgi:DnaK suppressor protein